MTTWQDSAACKGMDPDLFFPQREEAGEVRHAKAVCTDCCVREECLDYALANGERYGIWGGLSERQRRRIRRQELPVKWIRTCAGCSEPFGAVQPNQRYCGLPCQHHAQYLRKQAARRGA